MTSSSVPSTPSPSPSDSTPPPTTSPEQGIQGISFDVDFPATYGTSGDEFRIWVDVIYDWFGATLEHPLRRYLVSALVGVALFTVGLLLTLPFGLTSQYLSFQTPAAYLLCFDAAYSLHAFRWLSQSYHKRANRMRPCFPISDDKYREVVAGVTRRSVQAWRIFMPATVVTLVVWGYFAFVTFGPTSALSGVYPGSVPQTWKDSGAQSLSSMILIDLFSAVFILIAVTALHNTVTLIRLMQALDDLPVVPVPSLITDRAKGLLNLSLAGAVLSGLGIGIVQLIYGAPLNGLGIGFVLVAVVQGTLVYVVPRRAVNRLWEKARQGLLDIALRQYYTAPPSDEPARKLSELSDVLHAESIEGSQSFTLKGVLGLFSGQLLALGPVVLHALKIQQYIPDALQFLLPK